jgi:hypothetical protein
MGIKLEEVEEYIRLKNLKSPDGMWLMPHFDSHLWEGIYFCRKGPLAPAIIRFTIDNNNIVFDSGFRLEANLRLVEDPEAFQLYIKEKCDNGKVKYDKLTSFQYDTLYASSCKKSCIQFDDKISLKELCDEVSTIGYQ